MKLKIDIGNAADETSARLLVPVECVLDALASALIDHPDPDGRKVFIQHDAFKSGHSLRVTVERIDPCSCTVSRTTGKLNARPECPEHGVKP